MTTITHASFTVERTFAHSPEPVFRAFAEPDMKKRWLRQSDDPSTHHALDFRVDGREASVSKLGNDESLPPDIRGAAISNETVYHDISENERIVFSYRMAINGVTMSISLATVEITPHAGGSRVTYTEQGAFLPNADGPEMRKAGWDNLLDQLAAELERAGALA